jgi:trans-2,3-dihydro-3-hydroxyanthranilate isomerase
MARFRYVIADVFTDTPLQGNAVAVFTDAREIPEDKLQQIAREMNLSETVFVYEPEGEGHARIRIFTPVREMPFAGHPTLGTAFILSGPLLLEEIRLETGMGVVPVRLERDDSGRIVFGRMSQPQPTVEPYGDDAALFDILGVDGAELPVELYDNGVKHVYVCLGSPDEVAALRPDLGRLGELPELCFNCFAGEGARWKSRMFAPSSGVAEDPATGSAAGPLALHLARHGRIAFGDEIEISQGEEVGRPSKLFARVDGSADDVQRVEVGGSAVTVARGELSV